MIDARRMEVYTQVFDSGIGALTQVEAHVVVPESFADFRRGPGEFLIFGNGAGKCVEVMSQGGLPVRYVEIGPSARGLVAAAELAFAREEFEDIAYFEPFYLKDFVAGVSAKDVLRGGGK